ncbi:MAG: hypothetical protein Q7T40_08725 [Methylobacter sp.]|nr:hypothetical protein [Methylobacter sp.]
MSHTLRNFPRSHALRGNALQDAPRPDFPGLYLTVTRGVAIGD